MRVVFSLHFSVRQKSCQGPPRIPAHAAQGTCGSTAAAATISDGTVLGFHPYNSSTSTSNVRGGRVILKNRGEPVEDFLLDPPGQRIAAHGEKAAGGQL